MAKKTTNTPVVTLTGIRQSGKSTLLRHLFKEWKYITFDNIQLRDEANRDPALFLKKYPDKTIFDEAQKNT
ncbi:MAG: AAA family ATPase [Candidatus Melainabacteria bacterium]|nr:AAA family ATPase [Candidatus Melainabacteria bacterium]